MPLNLIVFRCRGWFSHCFPLLGWFRNVGCVQSVETHWFSWLGVTSLCFSVSACCESRFIVLPSVCWSTCNWFLPWCLSFRIGIRALRSCVIFMVMIFIVIVMVVMAVLVVTMVVMMVDDGWQWWAWWCRCRRPSFSTQVTTIPGCVCVFILHAFLGALLHVCNASCLKKRWSVANAMPFAYYLQLLHFLMQPCNFS